MTDQPKPTESEVMPSDSDESMHLQRPVYGNSPSSLPGASVGAGVQHPDENTADLMTDQPSAPSADEQTNSTRYPIPLKSGEEVRTYIAGGAMKESEFGTWVPLEHHEAGLTRLRAELEKPKIRLFPIMGGPAIPWNVIEPHERQAQRNHGGQTLARLAERGGLSPCEAVAVLEDRDWHAMPHAEARHRLNELSTADVRAAYTALLIDLRALVAAWQNESAAKALYHATMGIGWGACASELAARLAQEQP